MLSFAHPTLVETTPPTLNTQELNLRFVDSNDEEFRFRGIEMALPVGSCALDGEGTLVVDDLAEEVHMPNTTLVLARANENIQHKYNRTGQHEWLYDSATPKAVSDQWQGAVRHRAEWPAPVLKEPTQTLETDGEAIVTQIRVDRLKKVSSDDRYNPLTGELLGWEWVYAKREHMMVPDALDTPTEQAVQHRAIARE